MATVTAVPIPTDTQFERISRVSAELGVARWGNIWYVIDLATGQTIRGFHPSKMVAIAVALRVIEQGDYN